MSTATITVEELDVDLDKPLKCEVARYGVPCKNVATKRIRWEDCGCGRVRYSLICDDCLEELPALGYSCVACGFSFIFTVMAL